MLQNIINTFGNCFKIPELKSRILFTLIVLGICRVVAMIPIPGMNGAALAKYFDQNVGKAGGDLLGMYSMFTGGALERCAVGALGIMPYISAHAFSASAKDKIEKAGGKATVIGAAAPDAAGKAQA